MGKYSRLKAAPLWLAVSGVISGVVSGVDSGVISGVKTGMQYRVMLVCNTSPLQHRLPIGG